MLNPTARVMSRQVEHTTAATVALDTGCATLQNSTYLGLVTRKKARRPNDMLSSVGYGVDKNDLQEKTGFALLSGKSATPLAKKTFFCHV
jgi:hypothetical protein